MSVANARTYEMAPHGPRWAGVARLDRDIALEPLLWRTPQTFVLTGDLFHPSLSFFDIDFVFMVMALTPEHTFHVRTKYSARLDEYFSANKETLRTRWHYAACPLLVESPDQFRSDALIQRPGGAVKLSVLAAAIRRDVTFPLPNVLITAGARGYRCSREEAAWSPLSGTPTRRHRFHTEDAAA